jgi:HlyD family secretion protein
LDKLKEVRPVDVSVSQAQVDYAKTKVATASADLNDVYVRVPVAGRILKINTRIGEQVNTSQGIVELGQTNQMYAITEVYMKLPIAKDLLDNLAHEMPLGC